ncbi:putative serine racemase [Nitrospira sp. KM1]|uniref:threonine ammonia-lyase n=1 Tax=Nitrospira sp. KM1 TaxID=1936990 RepID=UPI0013A71EFB|nr:threonine ammonia-lyase [Nitrospira sp. KM1]BCA53806.1 putative serine racemase [Nitrospira sp. KM1]
MVNGKSIEAAAIRIKSSIYESPLMHSKMLSRLTGNSIFLKLENLQMTGSFKERGALNRILTMTDDERRQGVIAASAGNHGQGVAYHATQRGIPAQIWMPRLTPLIKLSATRAYGADVVLHGDSYDEACEAAVERSEQRNATFIHPFDDDAVIAGQGTIGLELLQQNPNLDVIVVPVGGGGLIGGVGCAVKGLNARVEVMGVQTARLPSMQAALQHQGPVDLPGRSTLADGIAVRRAGARTLPLVREYVDQIVTVDEDEIAAAILVLLEGEKTVAEGAGAIALAAILQGKTGHSGKNIAVLVSGGNLDVNLLARIIEQGMVRDGRRLRLRVRLPDYPGALEGLTSIIAKSRANIVETSYNRAHYGVSLNEAAIDITMETRGREHASELLTTLKGSSYEFNVIE